MKKISDITRKKSFYLLLVLFICASCNGWLVESPYSNIQDTEIEDSDAGADMWTIGAYNGLSRMFAYDEFPRCLDLDNDYVTGAQWAYGQIGAGNFQGSDAAQIDALWNLTYEMINRTNEAIYHIELMQNVTPKKKDNNIGELYFLQAWGYFMLVRAYGEIPLYKKSINQGEITFMPRSTVPEIYDHIINLLEKAKRMVYKNTDNDFQEGRVCAGAAASLLAKVYATIGSASMEGGNKITIRGGTPFDWQLIDGTNTKVPTSPTKIELSKEQVAGYESFDSHEYYIKARDLADSIVNMKAYGNHNLIPYSNLWKKAGRTSEEHFFALQTISGNSFYGNFLTYHYCGLWTDGYVAQGLTHGMRDHWYKLFEETDLRVTEGVRHRYVYKNQATSNGGEFYPGTTEWRLKATGYDSNGNKVDGYPVEPFNDGRSYGYSFGAERSIAFLMKYADVSDLSLDRTDAMYSFLRYADVVLIYAEASNEVDGPNDKALEALNSVRRRSNASEKAIAGQGALDTKEAFRSAVLEERAMELAEEGDRRFDLTRWGIYLRAMNTIGGVDEVNIVKSRERKHLLYPIPQDEILNNRALEGKNNPGWN